MLVADVNDEHGVGQAAHVLDTRQALVELLQLAGHGQGLALGQAVKTAVLLHGLNVPQTLDRLLDGLEIGQHSARPAPVDPRHTAAHGFLADRLLRGLLGADEKDRALAGGELADEIDGLVEQRHRLLEVDNVDFIAFPEDVGAHLGMPETGLVAEMHTGLQHLAHGNFCHSIDSRSGLSLHLPR